MSFSTKHIVAVRFFNWVAGRKTLEFVLNDNTLRSGVERLKDNLLVSLNNQTVKDFELVLLLHNDLPDNHFILSQLTALQSNHEFKIIVMRIRDFGAYVASMRSLFQKIIITRVDYDDLVFNNAVLDTQQIAQIDKPFIIYGYNLGFSWHDNTKFLYECPKTYNFKGHFSAFQSVVFNSADSKHNWIQPYMWDHSNIKNRLKELNIEDVCILYNMITHAYVWMRHANAGSLNPYETAKQTRIADPLIVKSIDFKRCFGKSLDISTI